MRGALELARKGLYSTRPNPMVGAVLVSRGGGVVGHGFHVRAGGPHAERHALANAGDAARGATLYCTLEPCDHTGRTGSCTEAIIEAGVARVVIGAKDPNPRVSGKGLDRLRQAGVEVIEGVLVPECTRLNEVFNHWIVTRRPFVTLKLAMSLDGRIAAEAGKPTRITSGLMQRRVHELRARADAVLVGSNTVVADDPRLNVRGVKPLTVLEGAVDQPRSVVVDSRLVTPLEARVCRPGTVIATALSDAQLDAQGAAHRDKGVTLWSLPGGDGRVDLSALLKRLGELEATPVSSMLVEGGGQVAATLLGRGLVQRWLIQIGPKILGAAGVPSVAELPGPSNGWTTVNLRRLGPDVELEVRPCSPD